MSAQLLDGKALSKEIKDRVKTEVTAFTAAHDVTPTLAVVRIGDDGGAAGYARAIEKNCASVSIGFRGVELDAQTTQSQDFLKLVYDYIKKKYKDVEIIDTICMETRQRQDELKKLAERSDAMVIIGSTESAHYTRLYEISKKINPKSVFVSRVGELDDEFFADAKKVGVTAGASTPEWIISEVIEHLSKI